MDSADTDENTRFILQALLLRDMVMQDDREQALRYADFLDGFAANRGGDLDSSRGKVYFIRAKNRPGRVKVGFSVSPKDRLRGLQVGNSDELILLGDFPGSQQNEKDIHRLMASHRVLGEWFHMSDEAVLRVCTSVKSGVTLEQAVRSIDRQ